MLFEGWIQTARSCGSRFSFCLFFCLFRTTAAFHVPHTAALVWRLANNELLPTCPDCPTQLASSSQHAHKKHTVSLVNKHTRLVYEQSVGTAVTGVVLHKLRTGWQQLSTCARCYHTIRAEMTLLAFVMGKWSLGNKEEPLFTPLCERKVCPEHNHNRLQANCTHTGVVQQLQQHDLQNLVCAGNRTAIVTAPNTCVLPHWQQGV